jgi:transposase-like protein
MHRSNPMIEVQTPDGPIKTDLPAEEVADLHVTPAPAPEPAKEPEPQTPAAEPKAEEPKAPETPKADPPAPAPEPPKGKAKPIANLLSKLNEERTAREALEKELADLKAKPPTAEPAKPAESTDDIAELAKKHGVTDPSLIKDIIETARKGLPQSNPAIPKEVQDLIAERQQEKEHQAELAAFNTRADKLATVFKDEPIGQHKDKLLELAYSTEKAPDGERYCDKELSELYFGFIKPLVEPGKPSAEPSRGGSKGSPEIMDFAEILSRDDPKEVEAMTDKQFAAYSEWMTKTQGDVPIRHAK